MSENLLQNSKEIPEEELLKLNSLIQSAKWRNTSTYPDHMAHSYTLRADFPEAYQALKDAIVEYGFNAMFFTQENRYLIIGNYKYWAYDTLVNRETLDKSINRMGKKALGG